MELGLKLIGCCGLRQQHTSDEAKAIESNKRINKKIRDAKNQFRREQKILLLGTGECGKSTFIKQMRIILGGGFPEEQYEYYKRVIHKNILQAGASLAGAMRSLGIQYHDESLQDDTISIMENFNENQEPCLLSKEDADTIRRLWGDPGVKECFDRRREYQLLDSAKYFLDKINDLTDTSYKVTLDDILRSRVRTTGIIEEVFHVDRVDLKIIDVGGQRRERRKWIHSFEGVTSVIFLASLSEYDMVLQECKTRNRTEESLQLFGTILSYPWFRKSSLILFLNKSDLFEEKIPRSNIADYFPDFAGNPHNIDDAREFMRSLYQDIFLNHSSERELFLHFTCATDTENIRRVFDNVKSTILRKNIEELNLG